MFSLREFVKKGLLEAIGKLPDYQIRLNAAGWYDKGVLNNADLAAIEAAIEEIHKASEAECADGVAYE